MTETLVPVFPGKLERKKETASRDALSHSRSRVAKFDGAGPMVCSTNKTNRTVLFAATFFLCQQVARRMQLDARRTISDLGVRKQVHDHGTLNTQVQGISCTLSTLVEKFKCHLQVTQPQGSMKCVRSASD